MASFSGAPQVPFEDFVIHLRGGARAPLANPLACGPASPSAQILPYTGQGAAQAVVGGFSVSGCGPSLPFSLGQTLAPENPRAGAFTPFTFNLSRADAQQYPLARHRHAAAGARGRDPPVTLCSDAQANAGTCPAASQIGTVAVAAGAGGEPYTLPGQALSHGTIRRSPLRTVGRGARRRRPV